jgi:hypothetical protein
MKILLPSLFFLLSPAFAQQQPIQKIGTCPLGFYASNAYCVQNAPSKREAIIKTGSPCPLGWHGSGDYCVKSK